MLLSIELEEILDDLQITRKAHTYTHINNHTYIIYT